MFGYNELDEMLKNASLNYNTRPVEKFENYSPSEMSNILNRSFEDDSIINFRNDFPSNLLKQVPFFKAVKYFLTFINNKNEIKLTPDGNLPSKYVKEIYEKRFINDDFIEALDHQYEETHVHSVHLTKVLSYVSKLVKTHKGSISLTRYGKELLNNDFELLKVLFKNFYQNYNLSYMDDYPEFDFSQVFPFFLLLLGKYGKNNKTLDFYYDKMINAFPALHVPIDLDEYIDIDIDTDFNEYCKEAFEFRLIKNFLALFNFITYDEKEKVIKKTILFDKLFLILPNTSLLKNNSERIM